MFFKTYAYVTMGQALAFTGDLSKWYNFSRHQGDNTKFSGSELGHYMKIAPRIMFVAQVVATIVSCFVVIGVQAWQFENIPDFCSPDNKRELAQFNGVLLPEAHLDTGCKITLHALMLRSSIPRQSFGEELGEYNI